MSNVPSLEKITALHITRETVSQLEAAELFDVLGRSKVCDLFAHCLSTAEGRAMVLTCMSRPRCSELWTHLDELRDFNKYWVTRQSQRLARNTRISFKIGKNNILYHTPDNTHWGSEVRAWSQLPRMYSDFRKYGVTEEEIQCIMGPIATHMANMFTDSSP